MWCVHWDDKEADKPGPPESVEHPCEGQHWPSPRQREAPSSLCARLGSHTCLLAFGKGSGSHGEGTCTDLVLFMDRTESTEEELNDGQVIIARGNVQTGVACLRTEIIL